MTDKDKKFLQDNKELFINRYGEISFKRAIAGKIQSKTFEAFKKVVKALK